MNRRVSHEEEWRFFRSGIVVARFRDECPELLLASNSQSGNSLLEKAWHDAENEDEREAVRTKAKKYLDRQFEADMKRRQRELEEIENRVEKLRSQLEKRMDKKNDIISLQLKQMTMSWEGLGWSDPEGDKAQVAHAWTLFSPAESVAAVPAVSGLSVARTAEKGNGPAHSQELLDEIVDAAKDDDLSKLTSLAAEVAEYAEQLEPVPANDLVWRIYEEVGEDVKDKEFWLTLAEAAEAAAVAVDQPVTLANILDTAARCYDLGGNHKAALKMQTEAVAASAEGRGGQADAAIAAFLKELQQDASSR